MTLLALVSGVHCPSCDRAALGPEATARWTTWFHAKDLLLIVGGAAGLGALPVASKRRYALAAVGLAAMALLFVPA